MVPIELNGYVAVEVKYLASEGSIRLLLDKFRSLADQPGDTKPPTAQVEIHGEAVEDLITDLLTAVPLSLANEAILQSNRNRSRRD